MNNEIENAIEYHKAKSYEKGGLRDKCTKLAISALEKQLEDGWIPVSEKSPEKEDIYQVTIKYENFAGVYLTVRTATYKNKNWDIHGPQPMILNKSVIAWQPLPPVWEENERMGVENE